MDILMMDWLIVGIKYIGIFHNMSKLLFAANLFFMFNSCSFCKWKIIDSTFLCILSIKRQLLVTYLRIEEYAISDML